MEAMREAVQCLPSDTNASYVLVDGILVYKKNDKKWTHAFVSKTYNAALAYTFLKKKSK
jgi:hypothetical protein